MIIYKSSLFKMFIGHLSLQIQRASPYIHTYTSFLKSFLPIRDLLSLGCNLFHILSCCFAFSLYLRFTKDEIVSCRISRYHTLFSCAREVAATASERVDVGELDVHISNHIL
jgi:hypothetical protein